MMFHPSMQVDCRQTLVKYHACLAHVLVLRTTPMRVNSQPCLVAALTKAYENW